MNVTRKDATITNTDEEFPGSFEVVLSTGAKDRDDDELAPEDWEQPLPDHITFDTDHGMSVATTVGSGVPTIEDGKMVVRGTYSSLPRAQEVRTLVKEKHIRTTSVAFMTKKVTKANGDTGKVRELLNGAFVAIPSNREAVVLGVKAGARNSKTDQANIQAAHDSLVAAGADCAGPEDSSGAEEGATGGKGISVGEITAHLRLDSSEMLAALDSANAKSYDIQVKAKYTAEQLRAMLADGQAIANPNGDPSYPIGDRADLQNAIHAVGRGAGDHSKIQAYIIRRARALGAMDLIPDTWAKSFTVKAPEIGSDAAQLAQAVDAALDEAWNLLDGVDQSTLPEPVQQALGLVGAAWTSAGKLLQAMNVLDPDADEETTSGTDGKSVDADALDLQYRALNIFSSLAE